MPPEQARDRAVVFIDGNNWFHALKAIGVDDRGRLDYEKISRKLLGPRSWIETRYYIGRVDQGSNPSLYAQQRRFISSLTGNKRISVHWGRIESRRPSNEAAKQLARYLANLPVRIDSTVFHDLTALARRHSRAQVFVEKAVDVKLAIDLVVMAYDDTYDAAYLLSADGDFTPAVEAVRARGKNVYAASPGKGAQLARVVNSFISLRPDWFDDCF